MASINKSIRRLFTVVAAAVTLQSCFQSGNGRKNPDYPIREVPVENVMYDTARIDTSRIKEGLVTIQEGTDSSVTYDLYAISRFFIESRNTKATKVYTEDSEIKLSEYDVYRLNDEGQRRKSGSLHAEVTANLVLVNGIVTIGKNTPATKHAMNASDPDLQGREPGWVGHIHTHPYHNNVRLDLELKNHSGPFYNSTILHIYGGKPSPGDHSEFYRVGKAVRLVMVDEKGISFYNGSSDKTVRIDRPQPPPAKP